MRSLKKLLPALLLALGACALDARTTQDPDGGNPTPDANRDASATTAATDGGADASAPSTADAGSRDASAPLNDAGASDAGATGTDYEMPGTHLYVDATYGKDSNPGTSSAPFKTLLHALSQAKGGDGIFLRSGDYGDLVFGANASSPIPQVFSSWVTIRPDVGHSASLGRVELGIWNKNGYQLPFTEVGNSDLWLRLDGLTLTNQLLILGSRHVEVRNCTIRTDADWVKLTQSGSCVDVMNGQHVALLDNEITHCGVGVAAMTTDFLMKGNDVHHLTHDGLKVYGGSNWLVEGNAFHEIDDGLDDDDPDPDDRNMHCDGIHMHTIIHKNGYSNARWAGGGTNVVFRGNLIFHVESMGVMVNQNDWDGTWGDYTWENNLFGPAPGRLFIAGSSFTGLTIRHNTVVFAPHDVWTSHFGRVMNPPGLANASSQVYHWQIWGNGPNVRVYNNIFASAGSSESVANRIKQVDGVVEKNLFVQDTPSALPYTSVPGTIPDFLAAGGRLGTLVAGSAALNAGTSAYPIPQTDAYQTPRSDGAPDIGAVEAKP